MCDKDSLGKRLATLGFIEGDHYLGTDIFHVQEDIPSIINMFIQHHDRWKNIVERAAQKVHKEHTTKIRAEEIHSICVSLNLVLYLLQIASGFYQ